MAEIPEDIDMDALWGAFKGASKPDGSFLVEDGIRAVLARLVEDGRLGTEKEYRQDIAEGAWLRVPDADAEGITHFRWVGSWLPVDSGSRTDQESDHG